MSENIFMITQDGFAQMRVQPYDSEAMLQTLLARYPEMLAGHLIDPDEPVRWLLITREAPVPDRLGSGARWWLDSLLVDQNGVPTLVEVKRSEDTRLRREVIGQVFDYAANGVAHWRGANLRNWFEARCAGDGIDQSAALSEHLGDDNPATTEHFWSQIETNLRAKRIRVIIVSDEIPVELEAIIEFLNAQLDPMEILALQVRQYVYGHARCIVPKILGRTAESRGPHRLGLAGRRKWSEESFIDLLETSKGATSAAVCRRILEKATSQGLELSWGTGSTWPTAWLRCRLETPKGQSKVDVACISVNIASPDASARLFVYPKRWHIIDGFVDPSVQSQLFAKLAAIGLIKNSHSRLDQGNAIDLLSLESPLIFEGFFDLVSWLLHLLANGPSKGTKNS